MTDSTNKLIRQDLDFVAVWRIPREPRSPEIALTKPVESGVHKRATAFITLMVPPRGYDLPEARELMRAIGEAIEEGERLEREWREVH